MQAEERLNGAIYSSDTHMQWIDREYYEAEISAKSSYTWRYDGGLLSYSEECLSRSDIHITG